MSNTTKEDEIKNQLDAVARKANWEQARVAYAAEIEQYGDQRELSVRKNLALDHYRGKTFSDSTNYRAKFDRFINSNESRIVELKAKQQEGK